MARCNPKPLRWRNVLGAVSFLICAWTIFQWAILPSGFSFIERWFISKETFLYNTKSGTLAELRYTRASLFIAWEPRAGYYIPYKGWIFRPSMTQEFEWAADISPGTPGTSSSEIHMDLLGLSFSMADYGRGSWSSRYTVSLRLPPWLIIMLSAILPMRLLCKRFSKDREDGPRCKCGYDLRATPDRCPECGLVSTPSPAYSWERAG